MTLETRFFLGYAPPSEAGLRRLRIVGTALVVAAAAMAAGLAGLMVGPGAASPFTPGTTLEGRFVGGAYPLLLVGDGAAHGAVLLVRGGKHGLGHQFDALAGRRVRVRGGLLERAGVRMLELGGAPVPIDDDDRSPVVPSAPVHVSLTGEIADSKCWLGRMRPGELRMHRACAQLCLAGGLPALLVERDRLGRERATLLVGPTGEPAHVELLPFAAEPVALEGELARIGDLRVLRVNHATVRRLVHGVLP